MNNILKRRTLYIKIVDEKAKEYYKNHSPAHKGDCGLDLFILHKESITLGETKIIDLGIQCEMKKELYNIDTNEIISSIGESFYLYPRSSTGKTPIRLANSTGIIDSEYRGNLKALLTYTPLTRDIEHLITVSCDTVLEYSPQQNIQDLDSIKDIIMEDLPVYDIEEGIRMVQVCSGSLKPFRIEIVDQLEETTRGASGIGSTGIGGSISGNSPNNSEVSLTSLDDIDPNTPREESISINEEVDNPYTSNTNVYE